MKNGEKILRVRTSLFYVFYDSYFPNDTINNNFIKKTSKILPILITYSKFHLFTHEKFFKNLDF